MRHPIPHPPVPAPPPPVRPATDDADLSPDLRPAAARLGDPRLRKALLSYVKGCKVPTRELEDVVQRALADAWAGRAAWPASARELQHWVFTIVHHRSVDEHRRQVKNPLVRLAPDQTQAGDGGPEAACDEPVDDGEVSPMVTPAELPEMREGLALAAAEVEKHPSWRRAFGWTLRSIGGEPIAEIAATDAVSENAVRVAIATLRRKLRAAVPDVMALFVFIALALILYGVIHKKREEAVPAPKPEHTIVAPTPEPPSPVAELRRRAFEACEAHEADTCLSLLDQARAIDPDGDADPRVQEARAQAVRALQVGGKK